MDFRSVPSCLFSETYCGGYSGEDPPLPIPNREVKPRSADDTASTCGKVGRRHPYNGSLGKAPGLFCFYTNPFSVSAESANLYGPFSSLSLCLLSPRITGITRIPSYFLLRSRSRHAEPAASQASGIAAASFRSAAEKDTAESPTALAGTLKGRI